MLMRATLPIAVVFMIAADEPAKDTKKELELLQGEWTMVSMETLGRKSSERLVKASKLTITGDSWIKKIGDKEDKTTIQIDPSSNPKTIDLIFKDDNGKEKRNLGIYKLEGDILTQCYVGVDSDRPKEFKTTAEQGIVTVWKRVKK